MTRLAIPPDIRFGVGGFPLAFTERPEAKDRGAVFAWLRSVGLDAIELQMTYGPRMTAEQGRRYRALAIADDIKISIHGSYYIVLASPDPAKVLRSVDTLLRTYEQADILGAREIVLHPGSLYGARLCCTNRVRDSSRESSVLGANHEQTDTPRLQDPQLAGL